ncbi:MAG: ExbD/TolR family protein [Thermodesulfobacteriota bacterium]
MAIETGSDRLMSDINVTPFVDVMLALLIVFMIAAPMMVQGVDVSLPQAVAKALPAETDQLIISVNKEDQVYINEVQVSLDSLREKLIHILENRTDREVYFRADQAISYGTAIRVMSEIKSAGVERLGMVTEPLKDQTPEEGLKTAS